MAEKSIIISAEEEAILLKPIDEYVGKIQEQIDALRVEGSDKVNSLKNQIAIAKENKNLTKEEQNKIIGECKKNLEKAKATEDANKQQIAKLIADAVASPTCLEVQVGEKVINCTSSIFINQSFMLLLIQQR